MRGVDWEPENILVILPGKGSCVALSDWFTVFASVTFGQLSVLGVEWFRHRMSRNQRRSDARDDFQRQTLLELQDTLDELALNAATVVVLQGRGLWLLSQRKDVRYDNSHAQALLHADIRLTTLAERIQDDEVRILIEQLDANLRRATAPEKTKIKAEAHATKQ